LLKALGAALPFVLVFHLGYFAAGLLPQPLHPQDVPAVDMIVVLTGGQNRLREAVQILKDGKSKTLFISGMEPDVTLEAVLKANRIESDPDLLARIKTGIASRNTAENAEEVRHAVNEHKAQSFLLVTSNYHMRRALALIRLEFMEFNVAVRVLPYPVESPLFPRSRWYFTFSGWRILLSEYFKTYFQKIDD